MANENRPLGTALGDLAGGLIYGDPTAALGSTHASHAYGVNL